MMKVSLILVSSLTAAIGSAEAKPFGIKPPARPVSPSKQISTALALRGGDLGPLTADTAAKALVGFQVANGYLAWQAAEGITKAWGGDKAITYKQKSLIEWTGFNMFTTAMVGVFLLNSASSSTALGLLNLMYSMNCVALLVDDFHGKFGLEPGGLLINNALYSVIAFGNLLNQEWATLANNVGAACLCSMFISTGKFKEVWKTDTGEGSISTLAWNDWIFTTLGNIACWIALMEVSEVNEVIAYSHIPVALLCIYNAFFSKAAKEVFPDSARYAYAAIVVALMTVILL